MNRKMNPWVSLVAAMLLVVILVCICAGCGAAAAETRSTPYHAIIAMPDGSLIEGECSDSWAYSYGMVSVTIDGVEYRTHSTNVVRFCDHGYS